MCLAEKRLWEYQKVEISRQEKSWNRNRKLIVKVRAVRVAELHVKLIKKIIENIKNGNLSAIEVENSKTRRKYLGKCRVINCFGLHFARSSASSTAEMDYKECQHGCEYFSV